MTGTFNNPNLILPPGVQGFLSFVANPNGGGTIFLTITAGVGPGTGGVEELLNPSFALNPLGTNWTAVGGTAVVSTNSTYPNTGTCSVDTRNVVALYGPNVAKITGSFVAGGSTNSWSQSVPVVAGSTYQAGAFAYVAHEDIMSGPGQFLCMSWISRPPMADRARQLRIGHRHEPDLRRTDHDSPGYMDPYGP